MPGSSLPVREVNHDRFLAQPGGDREPSRARGLREVLVGFVIGDDWTVAAAVGAALAVTWLLHTAGVAAWWLPPLVAGAETGASLRRISG